jgi:hypothetical protein
VVRGNGAYGWYLRLVLTAAASQCRSAVGLSSAAHRQVDAGELPIEMAKFAKSIASATC